MIKFLSRNKDNKKYGFVDRIKNNYKFWPKLSDRITGFSFDKKVKSEDTKDSEILDRVYLDWFIMSYFKVLPTDPLFKKLTNEQKLFLYKCWERFPDTDKIKQALDEKKAKQAPKLPKKAEEMLKKWHGSKGLEAIKDELYG